VVVHAGQHEVMSGQRAAVVDEALDELARLLHDGEVGGEVGVEHRLETEPAHRGVELPGQVGARRHSRRPRRGDAHRGRDLHVQNLFGIAQGLPDGGGLVVFDDGAGRAMGGALAAFDARRLRESDVAGGAMRVLMPRSRKESAQTFCRSWQTWMQRPHLMHLVKSMMIEPVELSGGTSFT
jgi:hypothetical protein